VVVSLGLEPYSNGIVLPHERTHEGPKKTQLDLLRATHASLSPILLLYDDPAAGARQALEPLVAGEPLLSAQDGPSTNRLWRITDPEAIAGAQAALADQRLVIADGHHRYETALRFHEEEGSEETAFVLAVLVGKEDPGLEIFPTHRLTAGPVPDLDGRFRRTPLAGPEEAGEALAGVERDHAAFVLVRRGAAELVEAAGGRLDTLLVDELPLADVAYTSSAAEAERAVAAGDAAAAFLVRAPTVDQVEAFARAGERMPPKSTYFFPKLTSGLLLSPFDE
jgi:uncharacterized protein (DUF1015 family)